MKLKVTLSERHVALKVAAYVIVVVAILFTISAITTVTLSYRKALENAHEKSEKSLNSTVSLLDSKLRRIEDATNQTAALSSLITNNPASAYDLLNHLRSCCPELMAVCIMFKENHFPSQGRMFAPQIIDFKGTGHYESFDASEDGLDYLSGEDDNWNASSKGEKFWSETFKNRYRENSYLFCYSVPMYDSHGDFIGILCAEASLDFLHETMESLKPSENSLYAIINGDDDIICYSDKSKTMTMTVKDVGVKYLEPMYAVLSEALHKGDSGMLEFTDPDKAFAYFSQFPKCNWGIIFSYPYDSIVKEPKELAKKIILVDIAILASLFAVLFFGILKIITPFSKKLKKTVEEKANLENELKIAADIQKEMIPDEEELLRIKQDIDVCAVLKPAKMVGGDFYDCYVSEGKLFFCLGDVSGKSMPAALFMAMTRSLFRSISHHRDDPGRILKELNREICASNRNSMFCTLFAAVLDLQSGSLSYCNAGHNPPAVIRSATALAEFASVCACCPIGAFDDSEYTSGQMHLEKGDTFLLYTDGITEAVDSNLSFLGEERLIEILSEAAVEKLDLENTVGKVLTAVEKHSAGVEQSDDITMLGIRLR